MSTKEVTRMKSLLERPWWPVKRFGGYMTDITADDGLARTGGYAQAFITVSRNEYVIGADEEHAEIVKAISAVPDMLRALKMVRSTLVLPKEIADAVDTALHVAANGRGA